MVKKETHVIIVGCSVSGRQTIEKHLSTDNSIVVCPTVTDNIKIAIVDRFPQESIELIKRIEELEMLSKSDDISYPLPKKRKHMSRMERIRTNGY